MVILGLVVIAAGIGVIVFGLRGSDERFDATRSRITRWFWRDNVPGPRYYRVIYVFNGLLLIVVGLFWMRLGL